MAVNKDNVDQMWRDWFMNDAFAIEKQIQGFFRILPHDPRCKLCNAPFQGVGGTVVAALFGRKQSSLNPQFCNICEEFAKKFPGGAEVEMSMLFVDVRGSTALSEQMTAMEFQKLINRFYVGSTKIIGEGNTVWLKSSLEMPSRRSGARVLPGRVMFHTRSALHRRSKKPWNSKKYLWELVLMPGWHILVPWEKRTD